MNPMYIPVVVIVSLVIGIFIGRALTLRSSNQNELQKQVDTTKQELETYKGEMSRHLQNTSDIMTNMKENYERMMSQIDTTNELLSKQVSLDKSRPFFSEETEQQLYKASVTNPETRKKDIPLDAQPKDYSAQSSGIFNEPKSSTNQQSEIAS